MATVSLRTTEGVPVAEVSFDLKLFENMDHATAVRLLAGGQVSLEADTATKDRFIQAVLFACGIHQVIVSEKKKQCVLQSTSATPE